jgi:hypothetical protein
MAANVPPPAPVFARYAASFNAGILDYSQEADRKTFRNAVRGMETPYNLKTGSLRVFLETDKEHVAMHGLELCVNVPVDGTNINILDSYGLVSMANCVAHAVTYVSSQTRNDQNSVILYHYLSASLTKAAKSEVLATPQSYQVETVAAGVTTTQNMVGITFLKVIIQRACVDTIATVTSIREAVSLLDNKMEETGSNIKLFNEYVQGLINMLRARGEGTPEFITHLFKGYAAASDSDFVQYMKEKRNCYEEEQPMDTDSLMQSALNKYNIAVQTGRWNAPDKKDATIFAMRTEIETLKSKRTGSNDKWAWKLKKPERGAPKTKVIQKKTYHWCPTHEMWTIHTPAECKGKNFSNSKSSGDQTVGKLNSNDKSEDYTPITLAKGLKTTVEFDDEDGYDE